MSDDLITWLRAQLDEDERRLELRSRITSATFADRMQAEVEAKRRILDEHEVCDNGVGKPDSRFCGCCFHDRYYNADVITSPVWCKTVRLLALPYAGSRKGYREEWRPA